MQEDLFASDNDSQPTKRTRDEGPKTKTVKAEVMTAPVVTVAKSGSRFCKVVIRDMDTAGIGTVSIVAFKTLSQTTAALKVGEKVTLTIKEPEKEGDSWILFGCYKPGQERQESAKSRIIREYGSLEAYKKNLEEYRNSQIAAGKVRVKLNDGKRHWLPKAECIQDGGTWRLRIDFLMDKLGPGAVKAELKKLLPKETISLEPKKTVAGFTKLEASWAKNVKSWIDSKSNEIAGVVVDETFEEDLFA